MIVIVDYGLGNLGSIMNMFKKIGVPSVIGSNSNQILEAEKIVLPGVGHFDRAMDSISESGILEALTQKAQVEKVPILGVCLGMQILTQGSEEGERLGLGWIPAKTVRFKHESSDFKVPHMGWNFVRANKPHPLLKGFDETFRFYFVHSYHVVVDSIQNSLLSTKYGYSFDSAIFHENIYGVQFHPEKSHRFGMHLLKNFSEL